MWTTFKNYLKKWLMVIWIKCFEKFLQQLLIVEIEALSKMQVFEEIEKGDQNILHIDGTKY